MNNLQKLCLLTSLQATAIVVVSMACADGNTITRPATAGEKAFVLATKQALKSALPALPAGWAVDHEAALIAEDMLTFPGAETAIEVRYSADFKRVEGMQERQALRDKAVEESAAARAKMQQLTSAIQEKIRTADKARSDGDRSAYEKAKSELESTQKEYDALMEGPENPVNKVNSAEYELRRDTSMRLKAAANSGSVSSSGPLVYVQIPNALIAVRRDFEDRDRASRALLLYGNWTIEKFGEGQTQSLVARRVPAKGDALTAVYTVAIELEADKARMAELMASVNGSALAGLISPPPAAH